MSIILITGAVILGLLVLVGLFVASKYTVVDPNEAHIVVRGGKGRKVYTPHVDNDGKIYPTAYFFFSFFMKRIILPLSNVKMEIPSFQLNDSLMAPFTCEAVCWFRIERPDVAVEKLDISDGFEDEVRATLEEQVRGIARAAAMKQEVLEIMKDRKTFGQAVEEEVNGALEEWGLEIVKLEIVDFSDVEEHNVICDYESMRSEEIKTNSRIKIATEQKRAEIVEAETQKESGVKKAQAQATVNEAVIEKDRKTSIKEQESQLDIERSTQKTNEQKIAAHRTLEIGKVEVAKEFAITQAEGLATAKWTEGETEANITEIKGKAEASRIKEQGVAEAVAKEKMADALTKYNKAGISLEQLKATVEIEKAKYESLGKALQNANVNLVSGGDGGKLLGFDLNAKTGAGLGQLLESLKTTSGLDVQGIVENLTKDKTPNED